MKKIPLRIIFTCGVVLLSLICGGSMSACEFKFQRKTESKEGSLSGVEDVIHIEITKNHRRCDFDFADAKFKGVGLKILAATPWKQNKGKVFERKLKVQYGDVETAELQMLRNCKEGLLIESYKIDVSNG